MHELWEALLYVAALAVLSQIVGPLLPRRWFHSDRFPFRSFDWEEEGRIYHKLHIRKWKDHLPDMSRHLKWLVPKRLQQGQGSAHAQRLMQETCVAESVHAGLIVASLWIFRRWRSVEALLFWLVYNLLGNLPFILIQRYNRPRLVKLAQKMRTKEIIV